MMTYVIMLVVGLIGVWVGVLVEKSTRSQDDEAERRYREEGAEIADCKGGWYGKEAQ